MHKLAAGENLFITNLLLFYFQLSLFILKLGTFFSLYTKLRVLIGHEMIR